MRQIDTVRVPSKYELYLESPEFAKVRESILKRDGYKCIVCGSTDNLQVHHLTYATVYNENPDDLITLCRRCHAIHHNILNREKIRAHWHEQDYCAQRQEEQKRIAENNKIYQERNRHINSCAKLIELEIKNTYADRDYAKNGDLDMCDWSVLNPIIEKTCKTVMESYKPYAFSQNDFNSILYSIRKQPLQNWFRNRRLELFLRCLDKGFSLNHVANKTKFDFMYLRRWYRRDKIEAKLKEEKEILANETY